MLSAIVLVSAHITTPPGQNSGKIEREDAAAQGSVESHKILSKRSDSSIDYACNLPC